MSGRESDLDMRIKNQVGDKRTVNFLSQKTYEKGVKDGGGDGVDLGVQRLKRKKNMRFELWMDELKENIDKDFADWIDLETYKLAKEKHELSKIENKTETSLQSF